MSTVFRHGYLAAESHCGTTAEEVIGGDYDFVLAVSSWDRRCVSLCNVPSIRADVCVILLFTTRDPLGLRDAHDRALQDFAQRSAKTACAISGESRDTQTMWSALIARVRELHARMKRPLKLLIDLSTCPRYYSLGLLAQVLATGVCNSISLFYAEGQYPDEQREEDQHELFTGGGWDAVAIPGLEGEWDPAKSRTYVVSVGFEGSKILRLISRAEPDRVVVLFPDPGVKAGYVQRTQHNNAALLENMRISEPDIVRAAASDAVAAWKALTIASVEREATENVYYVCCGTKPHSVALALRALCMKFPAVLYIVPDRHRVVDIAPLGVYWRYDVRDMSAIG